MSLAIHLRRRMRFAIRSTCQFNFLLGRGEIIKVDCIFCHIISDIVETEMYTYRTLFWWGHYLGFSLILKGVKLKTYFQRLAKNCSDPTFQNIYLSQASTPWEWRLGQQYFIPVSDQQAWADKSNLLDHMKIMRFHSLNDASFKELDWTQAGVKFWRDMSPVCLG